MSTNRAPPLKVWHNGVEWVIADSTVAATKLLLDLTGNTADDSETDWEELASDSTVTINYDDIGDIPDSAKVNAWFWACDVFPVRFGGLMVHGHNLRGLKVTATAAEWIEWTGRGFLCSTEY